LHLGPLLSQPSIPLAFSHPLIVWTWRGHIALWHTHTTKEEPSAERESEKPRADHDQSHPRSHHLFDKILVGWLGTNH
jgi:hypothetical protein